MEEVDGLNLRNLLNELASVIDKYYHIGIQLGISGEKLKRIENDYEKTDRCFSEMVSCWLDGNGESVTWNSLISALESPLVGAKRLAETLKQKYIKSREITSTPVSQVSQTLEEVTTCTVGSVCEEVMTQSHPESNSGTQDSAYESQFEQSLLSASDNKNVDGIDSGSPVNSQSTSPTPSVDPLFPPTEDRQILQKREKIMLQALTDKFKLESFRPRQKEAIENVLSDSQISQQNICDAADISYKSSSLGIPNPCVAIHELSSDDREDLMAHIDRLKREINMKFLKLQADLIKSLKRLITPAQLVQTLKAHTISVNSTENISSAALLQDHNEELITAKEIEDIFDIINPYLSYFDYELIEVIIHVHGISEDKENLQKYCGDFSEYCKKIPCVEFHEECSAKESKRTKIKFKLDYDRNQLKFGDVRRIRNRIAEILNLKPSVLHLHCIEDGCMGITFLVPTFFIFCLRDLITKNRLALQANVKLLDVEYHHQDSLTTVPQIDDVNVESSEKYTSGVVPKPSNMDSAYRTQQSQLSTLTEHTDSEDVLSQPTTPVSPLPSVESYFKPSKEGNVIATPKCVRDALKKFGPDFSFRPGQEKAIMNTLSGISSLVILPVGSGKSLCYQLPAYLYSQHSNSPCITLVISPLISLMEDQVRNFPPFLNGKCLHHNQSVGEQNNILQDIVRGKVKVLLLTPESLEGGVLWDGHGSPYSLSRLPPVAFACIDEVHCVSEWSHNFRPSYLRIQRVLRERLGVHCVLGLTATATPLTICDVIGHFDIDQRNIITSESILPDHLDISVTCEDDKDEALLDLLKKNSKFKDCDSMIVYCTRRKETERIAELLNSQLPPIQRIFVESSPNSSKRRRVQRTLTTAKFYHAGVDGSERDEIQRQFTEGTLRIVVATVAFGMGLNIPDIRAIIHYDIPKSFESLVQEVGRAGRDGEQAYCHIFIDEEKHDVYELRRHAYSDTIDCNTMEKLLKKIFPACQCPRPSTSSPDFTHFPPTLSSPRSCNGHKVIIPIEEMSMSLDINKECIATFLCYLEQQDQLKITNVFNDTCTLTWAGGQPQLNALMKKVPAVAGAVKLIGNGTSFNALCNKMAFSMIKVANSIGQELGIVRSQLSKLVNNNDETSIHGDNNTALINVEFSGQAYHIQSLGDFSPEDLNYIKEYLYEKMEKQEKRQLERLYLVHAALCSEASLDRYREDNDSESGTMATDDEDEEEERKPDLKTMIERYFSDEGLDRDYLNSFRIPIWPWTEKTTPQQEESVGNKVQSLIATIRDYNFTGKSVARIFHGIASPRFNPLWGLFTDEGRRFWRKHLDISFDNLCKIANKKLSQIQRQ